MGVGFSPGGGRFAFFAIRDCSDALLILGQLGIHNAWLLNLLKLPLLLIVYLLEFGFFALILVLNLRRDRQDPVPLSRQRRMAWMMFVVCLLTMSIAKSDATSQNDLGYRGMLVVQFVLLIWSAPLVHDAFFRRSTSAPVGSGAGWIKGILTCTLVLGVAGTTYQLVALRVYAPLADAGKWARSETFLGDPGFGERTYWMREGFSRLNGLTSPYMSVQYNPVRDEVLIAHLYSTRQAIMGDAFCESGFGGDLQNCRKAFPRMASAFNSPSAACSLDLDRFCDDFRVNVLVATDVDPVWWDKSSWVWTRPSLLSNPSMRAIPCGTASRSPLR